MSAFSIVTNCSVPDVGLEEAAIERALRGKWTPAEAQGRLTNCWVEYRIEFTLEK